MELNFIKSGDNIVLNLPTDGVINNEFFQGSSLSNTIKITFTYETTSEDATVSIFPMLKLIRPDNIKIGPRTYDPASFETEIDGTNTILSWEFTLQEMDLAVDGVAWFAFPFSYRATSTSANTIKSTGAVSATVHKSVIVENKVIVYDDSDVPTVIANLLTSITNVVADLAGNYYTKAQTIRKYEVTDTTGNTNLLALLNTLIEPDVCFIKWTQNGITYQLKVEITGENQNELRQTVTYIDTYADDYSVITMQRTEDLSALEVWTASFTTTKIGYNSTKEKYYFQNEDGTIDYVNTAISFAAKCDEAITKGNVLQVTGTTGSHITVKKAVYSEIVDRPYLLIGLAEQSASANGKIKCKRFGVLENINTNGYSDGLVELFLSTTTAGAITETKPANGNIPYSLGMVFRKHITQGAIAIALNYDESDIFYPYFETEAYFDTWINSYEKEGTYNCTIANGTEKHTCLIAINKPTSTTVEQNKMCLTADGINFQTRTFTSGSTAEWTTTYSATATDIYYNNAVSGLLAENVKTALDEVASNISTHVADTSNPHGVTASQVGLGNVDNTADIDKPVSTATATAISTAISNLVDSSPATLDTLNELSAALGDDPNFATTITTLIGTKLPLSAGSSYPLTDTLYGKGCLPTTTATYDLGSSTYKFNYLYSNYINAAVWKPTTGNGIALASTILYPEVARSITLGDATHPFGATHHGALSIYDSTGALTNEIRAPLSTSYNTISGLESGNAVTSATSLTLYGHRAGYNITTGSYNTIYGVSAGQDLNTGSNNSIFGYWALSYATGGFNNVAIGYQAGRNKQDGAPLRNLFNSVLIGTDTRALAKDDTNEIVIGYNAIGHGSNTQTYGNSSTTDAYIYGNLHLDTKALSGVTDITMTGKITDGTNNYEVESIWGSSTIYGTQTTEDLSAITKSMSYYVYGTSTGVPNSSYSWFVTHQNIDGGTTSAVQTAIADSSTTLIYQRNKVGSTWGSWVQINQSDSGWQTLTLTDLTSTDGIKYRKVGNLVEVEGLFANLTEGGLFLGTLPSGYRPARTRGFMCTTFFGSENAIYDCEVHTNGQIYIGSTLGGTYNSTWEYLISFSFLVD